MSTYGDMQARIADEIARADLTSQIQLAILSAIEYYKDDRFWFNEGEVSFYPTDDGLITGMLADHTPMSVTFGEIDEATITVSGSRNPIYQKSYEFIRNVVTQSTITGQPGHYAIFDENVWYDVVPDSLYPITFSGLIYLATLTISASTNAWTNEAERLIRYRAKADLFAGVTRNDKEAQKMALMEEQELGKLRQKTIQKLSSGRLKARQF